MSTQHNDRELMELAAKAAGIELAPEPFHHVGPVGAAFTGEGGFWSPLHDDGDALRLAVKLRIEVEPWIHGDAACARAAVGEVLIDEPHYGDDPERATRCAIVRAAAEIGKDMP